MQFIRNGCINNGRPHHPLSHSLPEFKLLEVIGLQRRFRVIVMMFYHNSTNFTKQHISLRQNVTSFFLLTTHMKKRQMEGENFVFFSVRQQSPSNSVTVPAD